MSFWGRLSNDIDVALKPAASRAAYKRPVHVYSDFGGFRNYIACGVTPVFLIGGMYYILGQVSRNLHQGATNPGFGTPQLNIFKGKCNKDLDTGLKQTASRELFEETAYTLKVTPDQLSKAPMFRCDHTRIWFMVIEIPWDSGKTAMKFFRNWWIRYVENQRKFLEDPNVYEVDTVVFVPLDRPAELWRPTRLFKDVVRHIRGRLTRNSSFPVWELVEMDTHYTVVERKSNGNPSFQGVIPFVDRYDVTYFHTVMNNFPPLSSFGIKIRLKLSKIVLGSQYKDEDIYDSFHKDIMNFRQSIKSFVRSTRHIRSMSE